MAENDGQEKTEQPSGKKLEETRNEGQVAKSPELNSFAVFSTGLFLLFITQHLLGTNISELTVKIFGSLDTLTLSPDLFVGYSKSALLFFFVTVGPVFLGLIIISLAAGIGQAGFRITPKALAPKFNKLNPLKGIKNVFVSVNSLVELAKSLLKLLVIGTFTYVVISGTIVQAAKLSVLTTSEIVKFMMDSSYSLLIKISLVFAVIAAADFVYQKYKFKKDLKMTKQEVKEENKQTEGDPVVKGKIKSLQFEAAKKRMMQDVPKADVVITNPTHFAIALKYDMDKDSAPKVLAKGVDALAQKIKKVAAENGVPLHEDRELARALYKVCDVGDFIPSSLFKAVAQVLAYVYKLKNSNKKKSIV